MNKYQKIMSKIFKWHYALVKDDSRIPPYMKSSGLIKRLYKGYGYERLKAEFELCKKWEDKVKRFKEDE